MSEMQPPIDKQNFSVANDDSDDGTGVENEDVGEEIITFPFDASLIRVSTKYLTIGQLLDRISEGALNLSPDFQRNFVWKKGAQSRLIESMFIRFPLPAFYMDATDDDHWLVVDGLQRLTSLKHFVLEQNLRLTELEFLGKEYNGKLHDELPASLKRRIRETQVTVYLIEKGTPPKVKFNIFKRINTGGLPLSAQEIRHALNQGPVTSYLARLSKLPEFKQATNNSVQDARMESREMVLRFLAFTITPYSSYTTPDLDGFLHLKMEELNHMSEDDRLALGERFKRSMKAAHSIFGKDAFRKSYPHKTRRGLINKALFEAWSVNLDQVDDARIQTLIQRRDRVKMKFIELMNQREFDSAVSQATGNIKKVTLRFTKIAELIQEVLHD